MQENKPAEKKVRGPKFTAPQAFRTPKGATHDTWCKSLDGQLKHLNMIKEEAKKTSEQRNYTPSVKIGTRFKQFFDEEVIDSRRRANQKNKRNK